MTLRMLLLVAAVMLAGAGIARGDPRPSTTAAATFTGCRWGRVDGAALSIWSFACPDRHLIAADAAGGFSIADRSGRQIVIRSFDKPAAAPIDAILPAVRRISGTRRASCRLMPHPRYGQWGTVWLLEPTGSDKAAYDAANARTPQDPPCGRLSNGPVGDRFFRAVTGDPGRIAFIDAGSEIQIFDPATLRARR